jgi:hypothetical protein
VKNILKSLFFITLIFSFVSCGTDRREMVSVDTAEMPTDEITFISNLNLGTIEFKIYSDLLKNVINGNLISDVSDNFIENVGQMVGPDYFSVPVSLKISNFNYFEEPINIVCEKDANDMEFTFNGKTVDNISVDYYYYESYANCPECNGVFLYALNAQSGWDVFIQGKADEINIVKPMHQNTTLTCEGYDLDNEYVGSYDVIIYKNFDDFNVNQEFKFLMQEEKIEGVVGVKKSNSDDTPVLIYNF